MNYSPLNKNVILLLIHLILLTFTGCEQKSSVFFRYSPDQILLTIESVSPNGEYAVINICDFSDTLSKMRRDYLILPVKTQIILDIKEYNCWQSLDTTIFFEARNFTWSKGSKEMLFSCALRQPKDTFELFPIYSYDLQSKTSSNLKKPWLNTPHFCIPLFSHKKNEIIFWAPEVIIDTLPPSVTSFGRVFRWDTLQKSIIEIIKNEDIASADWIGLYDTTDLFIQANDILWWLSLSTDDIENVLPDVQIVSKIRTFQNTIIFRGRSQGSDKIYVYDLEKKSPETILDYSKGAALSAVINNRHKLAVESIKDDHHWIFVVLKEGVVLDSLKGNSPFWLAGTDSLIYSEGKKIGLAYWQNKQLKREIILEIVK
ncbi:MAG: hypothetical protein WBB67_15080 [bacterium]